MQLSATPSDALIDVPRRVRITGAAPGAELAITAAVTQGDGSTWSSAARFVADAAGTVDLGRDAPVGRDQAGDDYGGGDYGGVDAMGLVWSARRTGPGDPSGPGIAPTRVRFRCGDASATITQHLVGPGVTRLAVREAGLVGTLFRPPGAGPNPAVMILNGSGGGINEPRAAMYASKGYDALALGYFRAPGLSPYISHTRLEYFAAGLDWMRATLRPRGGFVAISGQSRGGELALLLGATFPDRVSAVIGYVPGAVVHGAQSAADPALGRDGYAWLLDGKPIPHVWENNRTASWAPYDDAPPPKRHAHGVVTALDDAAAVARARIPVERIRGPVLVISGTDDGSWPSTRYSEMVMDALKGHAWPARHVRCEGAGHMILFPYGPTTETTRPHPVSGVLTTFGGTAAANAAANVASWDAVQAFLAEASGS